MEPDCRFSVADSEWSRDESEGERYTSAPIKDFHRDRHMYDIPPHMEAKMMLESVPNESQHSPKRKKTRTSPSAQVQVTTPQKSVPFCVKMYLVALTVGFFLLLAVAVFLVIRLNSVNVFEEPLQKQKSPKLTSKELKINDELKLLQQRVESIQNGQQSLLQYIRTLVNSTTSQSKKPQTCKSPGHINVNHACYFILTTSVPVNNVQASVDCWSHAPGAQLASFKVFNIQQYLGIKFEVGRYWVDGMQNSRGNGFFYKDGTSVNQTWLDKKEGANNCLSVGFSTDSVSPTWLETGCYDSIFNCICSYKV